MAIGFETTGFENRPIAPDKGMTKTSKPRVRVAKFGDGYEQRLVDGINSIEESYKLSFKNRPKAEIDDIVAFFDSLNGVTAFDFTFPDSNQTSNTPPLVLNETKIKVVCAQYNTSYTSNDHYTCSATFRRVYEA